MVYCKNGENQRFSLFDHSKYFKSGEGIVDNQQSLSDGCIS